MKLRTWQHECVELAIQRFRKKKHFLCLATPGAGKTTMAAELASRLIQHGNVDFILCFAPSLNVVSGLEKTFSKRLKRRFDGRIGAIGGAYTYQGMRALDDQFWSLLESHRVLVVFDEIHHCSGSEQSEGNSWGQKILAAIQHRAAFTLALTGTPWRSDNSQIVLAKYSNPEGKIQCDYVYGLKDAIRDGICRKPRIVLIDNERLKLSTGEEYHGVADLLSQSEVRYQHLLHNNEALLFCLKLACRQLNSLRLTTPNAGGLVVASSISHATQIARILENDFIKSVSLVTYKQNNTRAIIEQFRNGEKEWIVSVGMISEGTDIPRLQVCCHLSRITTELYFRQVLGRVLRTTAESNNNAWLYTFAEPLLFTYAQRVAEEIPLERITSVESVKGFIYSENVKTSLTGKMQIQEQEQEQEQEQDSFILDGNWNNEKFNNLDKQDEDHSISSITYSIECLGKFRNQLIDFFQTDLTPDQELI